ncbi:MAG: hypothetical protein ACREO1_10075 [Arenimonas sp.]
MRIAIVFHERDRYRDLQRYDIMHVAKYWQNAGHEVICVYGCEQFIPADIALLHIDLSVVPQAYLDFANRYALCLNKRALDIRKSMISTHLLDRNDEYDAPVIVKSNQNTAGIPERINSNRWSRAGLKLLQLWQRLQRQIVIHSPADYRIFDRLAEVPEYVFSRPDLVVEKFLPERDGEFYCTRAYLFLGDGQSCQMTVSRNPVVSVGNCERLVECDIHPQVVQWRQQLGFDYGKFDYVIHDGQAIMLDANKTTGSGDLIGNPMIERFRKMRADGLLDYYEQAVKGIQAP